MPVPNIRLADKGVRKSAGTPPLISTAAGLRDGSRDDAGIEPSADLLVNEDFENYQWGGSFINGFRWGNAPFADVATDITNAENLIMNFQFSNSEGGNTDAWAELNFDFETAEHDLWIKYRIYIPANYNHPSSPVGGTGSTNSKLYFMLESEEESGLSNLVAISGWPLNGGTQMQLNAKLGNTFSTHTSADSDGRDNIMAIPTSAFGTWQTMIAHVFIPPQGVSTGRVTIWIDGVISADWRDLPLNSTPNATSSGIKKGYFFGYMNSGVTEPFNIQMDDVAIGRTAESIGEGALA